MSQHHHLYNSRAWRSARLAWLHEHPLCRMHEAQGRVVAGNVVDHIKPHRGDLDLFWARDNWQTLCAQCHSAHKQAQEASASGLLRGSGASGLPLDLAHPWHQPARGGIESLAAPAVDRFVPSIRNTAKSEGGVYRG